MLKCNRKVIYKNAALNVRTLSLLFNKKQYRFYRETGFYIKAITVDISSIGTVKLVLVKNGYSATSENTKFIITDMFDTPVQDIVKKYLCRWDIEVFFRDIKQFFNFEKTQVRSLEKLEGYFSLVFISYKLQL